MGFLEIENAGKRLFEQFPVIKRLCKRAYQWTSVAASSERFKAEGGVVRLSPEDGYEYFYGYYDKSPWDASDRYILALKVRQAYKSPAPAEPGKLVLIDAQSGASVQEIAETRAWNVQQGCMAQWMGPDFSSRIIYNDFRDGEYCSVIYNVLERREEKQLPRPVYDISRDGKTALSLDFSRLHRLRPGYGYANLPDSTNGVRCPDTPCIWKMDIASGSVEELFRYTDFAAFEPDESMEGAEHKVNHLMISPNGKRFMVLHRWYQNGRKHTRLVTVNMDKTQMYNLSDDVFVSHCYWKNDEEILSFLRKKETGDHYYLMQDRTQAYRMYWPQLRTDGHCSYSPDGRFVITDTYPNRKRIASVYLCTEEDDCARRIARVFAPFRYDNDCRCDLHPRWNRKGNRVCIDSVHEGKRALYAISAEPAELSIVEDGASPRASVIIPCYNAAKTLPTTLASLEKQTYQNFEVIIVDDGSEDHLAQLVGDFKKNTKLDIVFEQQENGGVSKARNRGIRRARGTYLCFLDGDDVYSPRFLERMIGTCETLKTDVVLSYQSRDVQATVNNTAAVTLAPKACSIDALMEHFMYNKENIHFGGLLYKRSIVEQNQIAFTEGAKYGEDLEFAWKYLANCGSGAILEDKMYGYYNNPESVVNTVRWEKVHLVEAMKRVEAYMQERQGGFAERFSAYMLPRTVWTVAKTFAKGKRKDFYRRFVREYPTRQYMLKLVMSAKNKMLKASSLVFCVSKTVFYYAIGVVYKNR